MTTGSAGEDRFCHVVTPDGVRLDGLLQTVREGNRRTDSTTPIDLFLLLHGSASNFYASGVLERFANDAVADGVDALRINTRGHDAVSQLAGPGKLRLGGAAYEVVAHCRYDVYAWLDEFYRRGYRRVCLVGHSMGGAKSLYAQAYDRHALVKAVVAISAPRFCHRQLMDDPRTQNFRDDWARAQELVAQGCGEELIRITQPMPLLIQASGFIAKYGPGDRYDFLKLIPRIDVPVHVIIGGETLKTSPAFGKLDEQLQSLQASCPHLSLSVVSGAEMNYRISPERPFEIASRWLQDVVSSTDDQQATAPMPPTNVD
ncbi:MAG: alpha/beta hydrolase [Planctomycetaceae bacterium]